MHHALHVALTGETQGYYADFVVPEALPKVLRSPLILKWALKSRIVLLRAVK